jgi:DNA polymerase-3 subunit delta'
MKKDNSNNKQPIFNWPIIGHRHIIKFLEKSIINDKLAQAYLFVGPVHLGKRTLAEIFIANILCQEKTRPCGECLHCRQLKAGLHPDIFKIEREKDKFGKLKKNVSIEQIRLLKNKLSSTSFARSYKFALILEAEYLSEGAANALLKTLEEPMGRTILILITSQAAKVLPTIRSRCQIINFLLVSKKEIADHLITLSKRPNFSQTLASLSQGRPGVAFRFFYNQELLIKHNQQTELLLDFFQQGLTERFKNLGTIINSKNNSPITLAETEELLNNWLLALRDVILVKNFEVDSVANQNLLKKIERVKNLSHHSLLSFISNLGQAKNYLEQNVNPKLILENLILNFENL